MSFYKETEFESNGYNCIVVFGSHGHRCGYVGVPEGHPLYKKSYSEKCSALSYDEIKDQTQGKRGILPWVCAFFNCEGDDKSVSPDLYFDVHGSITFSGFVPACTEPDDTRWYFGFDCGHAGDENCYETALRYGLIDEKHRDRMVEYALISNGVHRTLPYCIEECKSLAAQLAKVEKKNLEACS